MSGQLRIGGRSSGALIGTANELSLAGMSMRKVGDSEGTLAGGETDGDIMHTRTRSELPEICKRCGLHAKVFSSA